MAMKSGLLLLLAAVSVAAHRVDYRNHKVLEVPLVTEEQAKVISFLEQSGLDVWTALRGKHAHIRVAPYNLLAVNETLLQAGMQARVLVNDVQSLIELENELIERADKQRGLGRASWVGKSYVRYSEIVSWIEDLPNTCDGRCAVQVIGKSYENRDIYVIRISGNISESSNRPVLFFETNIHAREWLSHASVAFVVQSLINKYGIDEAITTALDTYEWHFIVLSNPDGYEYTWTTDRYWRKTRSVQSGGCFGVDPNRNFDNHHCGEGTSSYSCSYTYCGRSPFSEKETQVIRDYTVQLAPRMKSFQSIHCYSQLLLLPYAYQKDAYPTDFAEIKRVAQAMVNTVYATSKKVYVPGNVVDLLYEAAGSSIDWSRDMLNVTYSMTWELRPAQNSAYGFNAPPSEITPTGTELLQALLTMSSEIRL